MYYFCSSYVVSYKLNNLKNLIELCCFYHCNFGKKIIKGTIFEKKNQLMLFKKKSYFEKTLAKIGRV